MAARLTVLASGSKGNSAVVASTHTHLLVDAGLSCRETFKRMRAAGEEPEKLDAILISHEHSDHVTGLEVLARKVAATGPLTHQTLQEAVVEGALLRLRPKVMTVATVVAGLLPLMWSSRTGAEVMKPLATPVLGGMVSSLLLVLIVTPVIFTWLREGEIRRAGEGRGVNS